jgi:putative transposase
MARQARLTVAAYAQHVIQRGNDRQAIVRDDADRKRLLALWQEHAQTFKVAVHAWVLMDNHFHLLLTPETDDGLPKMMQAVGRAYVRYFNNRHQRTGTLWEGRYRSHLIDSERYFLACMVYLDLNPVRAGMVVNAADHFWSSHRHFVGLGNQPWLSPHSLYWELGNTPFAREATYRQLVQSGVSADEQMAFTRHVLAGWAMGSAQFKDALQQLTPLRLGPGKVGRPPRKPNAA